MARTLTPIDVHSIMTALVHQATGESNLSVVDTSTFISAGEKVLSTGVENTLNSLFIVIGRTMFATRPYEAKLRILNALDTGAYTSRMRKISFYSRDPKASGDWNTDLYTNLLTGYDNNTNSGQSTASMWEQNAPVPLEMNFGGVSVWEDSTTVYKYQLKQAFRSESEFAQFVAAIMTEKGNDIEAQKEAYNRAVLLNGMAATYNMNNTGSVINLTSAYNDEFGTSYTSEELRTTYADSFYKFFVAQFKLASDYMTMRSAKYHWSPTKSVAGNNYTLLRHTPKAKQKCVLFQPMFTTAKAYVFPEIFNTEYLDIEKNYEGVMYWQSMNSPSSINITPAQTNKSTGVLEKGNAVSLDYVVGALFDEDAMLTDFVMDDVESTPMEARKRYYNVWWSMARNGIFDPTENFILFIMKDE